MMATEGEKRTAQIASNLAQETQQTNNQINLDFARSQQEFSDQIASQFDASVSRDLDQFAAQQTERAIIGSAESGFKTPRIQALAIPQSVQTAINDAAALNITQASGGFDFKSASMALRQQQDTAKRSAVQSAVEIGNYSEAVRLASESLRANDPIGYALANQTQDAPSAVTRALGGVRLAFGAIDVGVGTALSATGVGAYVGVPLIAYGADQYVAGSRELTTGRAAASGVYQLAEYAGASSTVATAIEVGLGLGLNVGAGVVGALTRPSVVASLDAPLRVPQGLSEAQFQETSNLVRSSAVELGLGDDVFVHGSRAAGSARELSDIDIGIRLSPEKFDDFLNSQSRLASPNPGSNLAETRAYAVENGLIQRGEARLSGTGRAIERLLGIDVDLSVIRAGGNFDRGPYIPLRPSN